MLPGSLVSGSVRGGGNVRADVHGPLAWMPARDSWPSRAFLKQEGVDGAESASNATDRTE